MQEIESGRLKMKSDSDFGSEAGMILYENS